ncbi:TetR/AcrR family transcriptional regulator [Altererythrobacter aquiaggeris]|uniref:TetR/AcrR family transcriptional regulator n=1 Tax=Aestuarierythrobacter aquiaggeris TaxID=1898396 RepID=UPI00301AE239
MSGRKDKILDAGLRLLATKGYSGLTHRAVDVEAGLPSGSTTYYFRKKIPLVEAVASYLATNMELDCAEVKLHFADLVAQDRKSDAIDFVADDLLKFVNEKKDWLLARFELVLVGAREPELKPIADRLEEASKQLTAFFLNLISTDLDEGQIDACVGILDGLAFMHATGRGPPPTKSQITRLFMTV